MNEKNSSALVPRSQSAIEKAQPGAKRILALMVSETLAIAKMECVPCSTSPTTAELRNWCQQAGEHYLGEGVPKSFSEAVKWWRKAADHGFAAAQSDLGRCYSTGDGVAKDMVEAVKWFRKAAEQGFAKSQHNLGICYSRGEGVDKDLVEAATWCRKAAEQGFAPAQCALAFRYEDGEGVARDQVEAAKWWRRAAEQGDETAQDMLGACYEYGAGGVAEDMVEAVRWYRKAAEQGFVEAQLDLAYCYSDSDKSEHVKWLRKAAEQGNQNAQSRLSIINWLGYLPEDQRDMVEAYKWERVHAEETGMLENLENIKKEMSPEDIQKAEALAREFMEKTSRQPAR